MIRRRPEPTALTLNLAPMVDVMMCLLIFFMLATKMVERENVRIDLPAAATAQDAASTEFGNRVVIGIVANELGEPAYQYRGEPATLDEVSRRLKSAGSIDPELNCVIRADRSLEYRHIEAVMRACADADIRRITFAAAQQEARRS
ncbi:biopolymer transport protein ExbD [Phycisphaerae bacterium RAS2]|nr:biopolymer transport protein ExbD [Phycisphaerae bacterium RAS2]